MSAFIVTPTVVNRICCNLAAFVQSYKSYSDDELDQLLHKMLKLNTAAVNYRYDLNLKATRWKFRRSEPTSRLQLSKDLSCFLYQCAEGRFDNTKLYKELQHQLNALNAALVAGIPGYDELGWGD